MNYSDATQSCDIYIFPSDSYATKTVYCHNIIPISIVKTFSKTTKKKEYFFYLKIEKIFDS